MNLLAGRRGRQILFSALYLSEGAPIGFLWWALPARLRSAGLDIGAITSLTAILILPWMFKFLWSPLIDAARSARWTLRSWILSAQCAMGAALLPLLMLDPLGAFPWMVAVLLVHVVAAATQDAAIDALAIASVPRAEQGSLNGWMQAGMLAGRSALGGGALLLEGVIGFPGVILLLIGTIWSSSILLLFSREDALQPSQVGPFRARFARFYPQLKAAFRSGATRYGILFALLAGAGFEAVGAVAGPFLVDRGFSGESIGRFFALNAVLGMLLGAVGGGYVADRLGKRFTVRLSLVLMSLVIFGLAASELFWASAPGATRVLLTLFYLFIGAFTASSYALFMGMTETGVGATQFSAFMASTNACESWSSLAVGRLAPPLGYGGAFVVMAAISLCALPLLRSLSAADDAALRQGDGSAAP